MEAYLAQEREKRLLARLGPKLYGIRAGAGGTHTGSYGLSPNDIAAGVSCICRPGPNGVPMADEPKQRLVMYIWAGHNSSSDLNKVLDGLILEASKFIRWKPERHELSRLACLALLEHIYPTPCRTCSATGEVYAMKGVAGQKAKRYSGLVQCTACRGTGRRPWGRRRLADLFGVTEWDWRKRLARPYGQLQIMVRWMEDRALVQIRRALRSR